MVFDMDPMATRLTNLAGASVVAKSLAAWLSRDGLSTVLKAAWLPGLLLVPAVAMALRPKTDTLRRTTLILALGPALVACAYTFRQLHMLNMFDGALLALLAGATASAPGIAAWRPGRWAWSGLAVLVILPGLTQLLPPSAAVADTLNEVDIQGLIERDFAHWLAKQAVTPGAVVLAAPNLTASLCYHGGLGGIGTFNWENLDGIKGSIRIAAATEPEEALALVKGRRVAYIVVPSWDMFLDKFAGAGLGLAPDTTKGIERSFVGGMLAQTQLPPWIELIPYQLPTAQLGADKWVMVFKVVDDQEPAVSYSRTTEYFIQMNTVDRAQVLAKRLRRYPSSVSALAARANVEIASGDDDAFQSVFKTLLFFLSKGADHDLPWDRRVSLAIALANGNRADLSSEQVQRCLAEIDETRLRSLTTGSLLLFQKLTKDFGYQIQDPRLRKLALELLPPGLRGQI
jgi:hypothetical protein